MSRTVQIPVELFDALCEYHLGGDRDEDLCDFVERGLHSKEEALRRRRLYSVYKDTAAPAEDRDRARRAYLDAAGISEGYRWDGLEPPC